MNTLKAEKRDMNTKAKKLRREGFVTGTVFGRELSETIPLKMEKAAVERLLKSEGKGGRVLLDVEGQVYNALIKEVDYNPLRRQVDEIDFQALVNGEKVHSTAEIHLVGADMCAGVPELMLPEISYRALPDSLTDRIQVNISHLKAGDSIKVGDLDFAKDENIELMTDLDKIVVAITEAPAAPVEEASEAEQ